MELPCYGGTAALAPHCGEDLERDYLWSVVVPPTGSPMAGAPQSTPGPGGANRGLLRSPLCRMYGDPRYLPAARVNQSDRPFQPHRRQHSHSLPVASAKAGLSEPTTSSTRAQPPSQVDVETRKAPRSSTADRRQRTPSLLLAQPRPQRPAGHKRALTDTAPPQQSIRSSPSSEDWWQTPSRALVVP